MEEKIKNLIRILEKEADLYEQLLRFCKEEKTVIIKGDLKALEKIVKKQEDIFFQLQVWEKARGLLMNSLKEILSLSKELTLSRLIKKVNRPFSSQLKKVQKKIISLIKDIKETNKTNISLITYSIRFVEDCFNFLAGVEEVPVYTPEGKTDRKEQKRKLLDQRT